MTFGMDPRVHGGTQPYACLHNVIYGRFGLATCCRLFEMSATPSSCGCRRIRRVLTKRGNAMKQGKQEKARAEPAVMNTANAAAYLDMRPGPLEIWRSTRRGPPYIKVGRSVRYRRSDLDAWLDQRTHTAAPDVQ